MSVRYPRLVFLTRIQMVLVAVLLTLLVGCHPEPSPAPPPPDFTQPGAAQLMIDQLIEKADSDALLMVAIQREEISVSVLADQVPQTWAYRNNELSEVPSDLTDVDQATFRVNDFNLTDVGALFRAASGVSGSEENQVLQIVDYSGGRVMMSVSTNPESRTVFFNPDGSLLQELDFTTKGGIAAGLGEVTQLVNSVYSIGIDSTQGAWVDYRKTSSTSEGVVRSQRIAAVPLTSTDLATGTQLQLFNPALVDAEVIWDTLHGKLGTAEIPAEAHWSVVVEVPPDAHVPRLRFTIGNEVLVTDLKGNEISD